PSPSTVAPSRSGGCRVRWAAPTASSTARATSRWSSATSNGELRKMGQKTHPTGFRLGIIKTWSSRWYEEKNYAKLLHEDLKLKKFIKKKLNHAGVSFIEIERAANKAKINIHTARPGIVIGKRGAGVETLKK